MEVEQLLLFLLLALFAEVIGTIGGFGSSLFFVPIATYFYEYSAVLGITAVFHVVSNINKIALFRQGIQWKLILTIGLPSVLCVIIGAYLSSFTKVQWMELALGVFLVVLSLLLLIYPKFQIQPGTTSAIAGGSISGFLAGILGTGGAVRGLVLSAYAMTASTFIATSAMIDLGVDLSRSVVYVSQGYVQKEHLMVIVLLFPVSYLGTWLGKKIVDRFSQEQFRRIVLLLILLTGLFTLWTQLFGDR